MLNKPKFMTPSTNLQECAIDFNSDVIPFSCIVDGNEAVYSWQIKIYSLDKNILVYRTGKVSFATPFFPIDEKNKNEVFSINIKNYSNIMSEEEFTKDDDGNNIIFKNSTDAYYWIVEFWNKSDNDSDAQGATPTVSSTGSVFYANDVPKITIYYSTNQSNYSVLSDETVLNAKTCYFKATYEQEESTSPLKKYGWKITDTDSGQVLVNTITHNQIYGTKDNIVCFYDGFLNDGYYSVELSVETQNGTIITTKPITFYVSYLTTLLSNDFKVSVLKNESGIIADWSESVIVGGRADGNISYKKNYPVKGNCSVFIPQSSSIIYDYAANSQLDISEDVSIVLSTQMEDSSNRLLFTAEGTATRRLMFFGGKFIYTVINSNKEIITTETYVPNYQPSKYVWYIITMTPTSLSVVEKRAFNGLYPSTTLYPSASLYPSFGEWEE